MFEIGAKIRFKYTGMEAEIVEDHSDGSYTVWLIDDEDESIAFVDDILLSKDFKGIQQSEQQKGLKKPLKGPSTEELFYSKDQLTARKIAALQPKHLQKSKSSLKATTSNPSESAFIATEIFNSSPAQSGCYLVFHQTSPTNYTIYLVNDTLTSFGFEFKLLLKQQVVQGFNKIIPVNTFFPIGELLHEQFNDSPSIEFKCPRFNFTKQIKLKYRKFISTVKPVPLMGLSTYSFLLFKQLNSYSKEQGSLQDYTNNHQEEQAHIVEPMTKLYRSFDLMDIASFEPELDLHAEKLVNDTSEFTARELYELQLQVLEHFVIKAVHLDLKEVFIIHGLGKGKLKQGVDDFLRFHGDVKTYKNEFHEKYGFGATKVIFK